jgi:hypothetical protein
MHHDASPDAALCIMPCYSESHDDLPPEISHREGISVNKATIRLLEARLRKPVKNTDFDEFCGTWSKAEADRFDKALRQMRQIDPADWESPK